MPLLAASTGAKVVQALRARRAAADSNAAGSEDGAEQVYDSTLLVGEKLGATDLSPGLHLGSPWPSDPTQLTAPHVALVFHDRD